MIDTTALPIVDVHCHPFAQPTELSGSELVNKISFAGSSPDYMVQGGVTVDDALIQELQRVRRDAVYFRYLVRQLAQFFGCEPEVEQVAQARNKAMQDYPGYVKNLLADCGLTAMVADFGYPQPPLDPVKFGQGMPVKIIPVYRIEPLIVELLKADIGWDEFRRRYDETIAHAIKVEGYRGLKSIIAYRTGLDISPLSRTPDQGLKALDAVRRGIGRWNPRFVRNGPAADWHSPRAPRWNRLSERH
jgi:hypothetical protein